MTGFTLALALVLAQQQPSKLEEFIYKGWAFGVVEDSIGTVGKLGRPLSIRTKPVKNLHVAGQIDVETYVVYPGLEVDFLKVPHREFVTRVDVRSAKWPVRHGLSVGTAASRIQDVLGKGHSRPGEGTCYADLSGYSRVCFTIAAGKIERVRWISNPD